MNIINAGKVWSLLALVIGGRCAFCADESANIGVAGGVLDTGTTQEINVPADENMVLGHDILISDRVTIEKTGKGTWEIDSNRFPRGKDVVLKVREGTLKVREDSTVVESFRTPEKTEVLNKATLWFDFTKNVIKDENGNIEKWYDARESDVAAPQYVYAQTDHTLTSDSPVAKSISGKETAWFGSSMESGRWMNWHNTNGSQANVRGIRHAFIVRGIEQSGQWIGHIIGQRSGQDADFHAPDDPNTSLFYIPILKLHNLRIYRDGNEVDFSTTPIGTGLHVDEVECMKGVSVGAQCFANGGDYWKDENGQNPFFPEKPTEHTNGGKRVGGGYLAEVIFFREELTAKERIAVHDYLREKWLDAKPSPSLLKIEVAKDAIVELASNVTNLIIHGEGTVVSKDGGGDFLRAMVCASDQHINFRCEGEKFTAGYPEKIEVVPGQIVEIDSQPEGFVYTSAKNGAPEGVIIKKGSGPLMLDKVPEGTSKIVVEAGSLTLRDPAIGSRVSQIKSPIKATIPDADFETYVKDPTHTEAFKRLGNGEEYNGWHAIKPSDQDAVIFFDSHLTEGAWGGLIKDVANRSGVLIVKTDASAWCEVEVPQDGMYQLSFFAAPRNSIYMTEHLDIMIGKDESSLKSINGSFFITNAKWRQFTFMPIYLEAGTHQLWLKSLDRGIDSATQFDNFELVKVPDVAYDGDWMLPNGDFETEGITNLSYVGQAIYRNSELMPGYQLTQSPDSTTANNMCSTFTTRGDENCVAYNLAWSSSGKVMCLLHGNGAMITSDPFLAPEGTWQFALDASNRFIAWNAPTSTKLLATLINVDTSEETDLGAITLKELKLARRVFPVLIAADGKTRYRIRLTTKTVVSGDQKQNESRLLIDNLRLTSTSNFDTNLINGNCENINDWNRTKVSVKDKESSCIDYSWEYFETYFGTDRFEGRYCINISNDDYLYQKVTINEPGTYRLISHLAARIQKDGNLSYGENGVEAYVACDGITNRLGKTSIITHSRFTEYSWAFKIDKSGTYDIGFQGLVPWTDSTADKNVLIDAVSLHKVDTSKEKLSLPRNLIIEVNRGATLNIGFDNIQELGKLKIDSHSYNGEVSLTKIPGLYPLVQGYGEFFVKILGTRVIIK